MELTQSKPVAAIKSNTVRRQTLETIFWYIVLCLVAVITIFPFVWVFSTSLKGPTDAIYSVPPQLIPRTRPSRITSGSGSSCRWRTFS